MGGWSSSACPFTGLQSPAPIGSPASLVSTRGIGHQLLARRAGILKLPIRSVEKHPVVAKRFLIIVALLATFGVGMSATGAGTRGYATGTAAARFLPGSMPSAASRATRVTPPTTVSSGRIVGYFTSWGIYDRDFQVADVAAGDLTHLNYAFANVVNGRCEIGDRWADVDRTLPSDDPSLAFRGNFNQLQLLKAQYPELRTLITVGGSTWSGGFSSATATEAGRRTLAASCIEFMATYGFDGIDIDWEYPVSGGMHGGRPEDRANYTAFLTELRAQIDEHDRGSGTRHLLTIAAPAGPTTMANLDIPAMVPLLDWVNVMTYDFAGDWSPGTGHNAPLYDYPGIEDPTFSVHSALLRWQRAGAPADKLNVGLAFYGRGYGGVTSASPGSAFSSVPTGTTQPGQFDFGHLVSDVLPGMRLAFDETAMVPFAYRPSTGVWISYDNERSIEAKGRYARAQGLGGVMIWELSNDVDGQLLAAARRGLSR
jgi:chitinase